MVVGVAHGPIPVAAVIMIPIAVQPRTSAPAFLLRWMLGILSVGFIVFLMPGLALLLIFGALLISRGVRIFAA
jgi:hypothetical protein